MIQCDDHDADISKFVQIFAAANLLLFSAFCFLLLLLLCYCKLGNDFIKIFYHIKKQNVFSVGVYLY